MATQIKFQCNEDYNDFIVLEQNGVMIQILGNCNDEPIDILLDIPTAIKLHKTLRTEINKAKEVQND